MSNFIIQIIRTLVPLAVGYVVAQLARLAIPVDPLLVADLTAGLSVLAASLYYIGVAWLERKWPWFGWLLGIARNPVYAHPVKDTADGVTIFRSSN